MTPLEATLALTLCDGVGPVVCAKLINAFGSPAAALAAPEARLAEIDGVGRELARRIAASRAEAEAKVPREFAVAQSRGARILAVADADFPAPLRYMHDTPPVLYVKGTLLPADRLAVAIVGSRSCTYYGRSQAELLAAGLARCGVTVVSGLARGIDAAAHEGALQAGGRTLAVLGNGLSQIYPPEHAALAEKVAASGALLSEFPMLTPPAKENFPRRNRIISALALGVLVVEGDERSGALITAAHARDQGREVFALPGKVDNPAARGPHRLIRSGATLVESVKDILDALGPVADGLLEKSAAAEAEAEAGTSPTVAQAPAPAASAAAGRAASAPKGQAQKARAAFEPATSTAAPLGLNQAERALWNLLSTDPQPIDQLIAESGLAPQEVSSTLMILEIKRACRRLPGDQFVRG